VTDRLFVYGTLMSSFRSEARQRVDAALERIGSGLIRALLYDLGPYPAAFPAPASDLPTRRDTHSEALKDQGSARQNTVSGEVHRMSDPQSVLRELDEFEGYDANQPDSSLFVRAQTTVELTDGGSVDAWVYFYARPLESLPASATRIESGDYLTYIRLRGLLLSHDT